MSTRRPPSSALLLLVLLAACGGSDASPPVPPAAVAAPLEPTPGPPTATTARARPGDELCTALGRIVDSEPEGFLGLRASRAEPQQWNGRIVPSGFADCWIEDGLTAGARYVCSGTAIDATPDPVVPSYLGLLGAVEACLAQPIWYPLTWQRVTDRRTPRGGQQSVWQVPDSAAAPAVALALDRHPERQLWFVRLTVGPVARTAAPQS
jgi:hypothetical protein